MSQVSIWNFFLQTARRRRSRERGARVGPAGASETTVDHAEEQIVPVDTAAHVDPYLLKWGFRWVGAGLTKNFTPFTRRCLFR